MARSEENGETASNGRGGARRPPPPRRRSGWRALAVWGPGVLAALADTDAGNVVTAAQSGEQWGYRLMPLLLLLTPALYMVQELTVRLGIYTGRGHGELIRERFGTRWALLSMIGLAVSTIGSLITEFTAVAGVGEMVGIAREQTLPIAAALLFCVVLSGTWRRIERVALLIGLCELVFFYIAWAAHPHPAMVVRHAIDWPIGNRAFLWSAAGLIGAVFNPWMIFYQQAAVAPRHRQWDDYRAERRDTAVGAVLTQLLTAAVLVASAAIVLQLHAAPRLETIGDISAMLISTLGTEVGGLLFGVGVLGASMVAAIVASLALAGGVDEWAVGNGKGKGNDNARGGRLDRWFICTYATCVAGSAVLVWLVPDLVSLTVALQVVNTLMLPLVMGLLIALAVTVLPRRLRPRGAYLFALVAILLLVTVLGVVCAVAGAGAF
ncbi:NRAMP family divalent metal transporter [Paraburkholderia acidipaludis]|uniref:NRAMP family divalent metal transporter n=1 Tax=Paraburkholderia acidipaludis TaxID=660537 RepID=UPI000B329E80|nr:divalent metal cation transporter [Paraburkholderia acidipaludis]